MPTLNLSCLRTLRGKFRELLACDRGSVAPLVGVAMITLVGAVGVAVDVGRGQVAQSKLQAALDSAGLAAGAIVGQSLDSADLKPEAQKYLDTNFAGETIDAEISAFDLVLSDDNSIVTLEATATLPTTFMRIFGETTMQVSARSEITRETKGLEVALVLDLTGSMNNAAGGGDTTKKMVSLRAAAKELVNILFGSNETVDDLWIGIVPFASSVNIGASRSGWLDDFATYTTQNLCIGPTSGTPKCSAPLNTAAVSTRTNPVTLVDRYMYSDASGWYFAPHSWRGCVMERWATGRDLTDDTPATQGFGTFFTDDSTSGGLGNGYKNNWRSDTNGNYQVALDRDGDANAEELSANRGCPEYPITTLTNTKSTLTANIDAMLWPNGYTHINVGAVWGWRLLSPKWRGLWGGDMDANDLPLEYDEPLSQKAVILMTDGDNTMWPDGYTAYGFLNQGNLGTTNQTTAKTVLNNKTTAVCNAMKAEGILVYTIVFGNEAGTAGKTMMKGCASEEDYYFDSPTQTELTAAFRAIGDSLSKLRVSK